MSTQQLRRPGLRHKAASSPRLLSFSFEQAGQQRETHSSGHTQIILRSAIPGFIQRQLPSDPTSLTPAFPVSFLVVPRPKNLAVSPPKVHSPPFSSRPVPTMHFMRKVRKPSRIHDDLPVGAASSQISIQQESIAEGAEDAKPCPSGSCVGEAQHSEPIKRSVTLHEASGPTADESSSRGGAVQRGRSLTTDRPTLQIPGSISTAEQSPASLSPVVFSLPDGSLYEPGCSPHSSTSSLVPSAADMSPARGRRPAPAPNYVRPRVKAFLDSSIPGLNTSPSSRPSTPSVLTPSPTPSPLPSQSFDEDTMLGRSASLRGPREGRRLKRRLSLDLRSFAQALPSPRLSPPLARAAETARASRVLRKARSIARLSDVVKEGVNTPPPLVLPLSNVPTVHEGHEAEEPPSGQITEKQRLLAIKRARKLTKLFGDELPLTLAQLANAPTDAPVDDLSAMVINARSKRRDSRASFISDTLSSAAQARFRDSVDVDASEPSSPVVMEDDDASLELGQPLEDIQEVDVPPRLLSTNLDSPVMPNTAPATPSGGSRPFFSRTGTDETSSRTLRSQHSDPELHSQHRTSLPPPPPRTPPPFSNLFSMSDESETQQAAARVNSHLDPQDDFRARRMRAEKLSRFFGVDARDLQQALPRASSVSRSDAGRPQNPGLVALLTRGGRDPSPSPRRESRDPSSVEVAAEVVGAKSRFRIGRYGQNVTKEMDMHEVIDQLRKMK